MIWVSSSAVLAVVCALSLFWVVPRLQRRREAPVEAQVEIEDSDLAPEHLAAEAEPPPSVSRRRRITMATTDTTSRRAGSSAAPRSAPGSLHVRWDRTGIFLAGCAALLAAVVTAVVAPFSAALAWPWPVFLGLLGVGSVLALRYLAVQERAARRAARPAPARPADPHAPRADVSLFDHQGAAPAQARAATVPAEQELDLPAEHEQPQAPAASATVPAPAAAPAFTVEELRAEALRVARESGAATADRTWEPVPVPKPTYAAAPVVQRPEPEPLPVPEQPAARSATLKEAVRTGEERGRAALDLDDVLKRRRA
jgi:hypothetical protein